MNEEAVTERTGEVPAVSESAYDVVSFGDYWGLVSILFFVASLVTRQALGLLPPRLQGYHMMPPLAVTLVPMFSGLGVLCALLGGRKRGTARIGFFANLVVFFLSTALVAIFWLWRRSYLG